MEAETLEQVQARHRKEQKELQGRITSKKKNATKKTRKGVNDECAELERGLRDKQLEELQRFGGGGEPAEKEPEDQQPADGTTDALAEALGDTKLVEGPAAGDAGLEKESPSPEEPQGGKKRNRQKERLARRAAEQEAAAAAAEEEASGMVDRRGMERANLTKTFAANGLVEKEIAPDGHCLFSAMADQLQQNDIPVVAAAGGGPALPHYKATRRAATAYMEAHPDDFAPFIEAADEGGGSLAAYAARMRDTAEWGGQLELTALAAAYGVEVRVVQDGRTEVIRPPDKGDGDDVKTVWLAYYRHGYGLGEHYNSLRKKAAA